MSGLGAQDGGDQRSLLNTIEELSVRGLINASKWLAELLSGSPLDVHSTDDLGALVGMNLSITFRLAKSLFDCSEYMRCSHCLSKTPELDARSLFLKFYSLFLAGEKDREDRSETVLGPQDGKTQNPHLVSLLKDLERAREQGKPDTYLLYLLGVLYRQLEKPQQAIPVLLEAVKLNEYNWAAWEELSACMTSAAGINKALARLPDTLLSKIFNVVSLLDLHLSGEDVSARLTTLEALLPGNLYIKSLRAILAYNAQDFEAAEMTFDEILEQDPYRIDNVDTYSNVLFVLDRRAKLSSLAKTVIETDKFRPETCCVVGNYYSLISDHEKAVTYFRRALKLNKSYLAAWTLMGHEYVELKNTHAAIESYRRAVDINKKDYRAWYGLGQAYEMLEMHFYALHYFQRAAALKPYDLRMWTAMGNCYEKLGRLSEAIKAFRRALLGDGSLDVSHLMKIGELYERAGDLEEARKHFRACVEAGRSDSTIDITPAQEWLDRFEKLS